MERESLLENLATLEDRTHALIDWRRQVRHRPLEAVGVALVGGVLLAILTPRRPPADPDRSDGARARQPAHPLVDRFVSALAVVAAERAVEALEDLLPSRPAEFDDGPAWANGGASA